MTDRLRLLDNRKAIPLDLAHADAYENVDVLDVSGAALTRPAWRSILQRLGSAGAALRVLLLDPASAAVSHGAADPAFWWDDAAAMREQIRTSVAALGRICAEYGVPLEARYYRDLPVSRYVRMGGTVYQTRYPDAVSTDPVAVAVLDTASVLGGRALREFDVLWRSRSTLVAETADVGPGRSARVREPDKSAHPRAGTPWRAVPLIANRKAIPEHLSSIRNVVRHVDVLDVAGAAQVGDAWLSLLRRSRTAGVTVRVLLLDPDGTWATARARESTRWRGDDAGLRRKLHRNIGQLSQSAADNGFALEIRVYDELPVSRYVRADDVVYQSYYPSNSSAKDLAIAVLDRTSVLAERAEREFEVMWSHRSTPPGSDSRGTEQGRSTSQAPPAPADSEDARVRRD